MSERTEDMTAHELAAEAIALILEGENPGRWHLDLAARRLRRLSREVERLTVERDHFKSFALGIAAPNERSE